MTTPLIPPITALTPNDAQSQLQQNNLDALGLVAPNLGTAWSATRVVAADYDPDALRLTLNAPLAPFRAALRFDTAPARFSDVLGAALTETVAVLELHPEAAHRLVKMVQVRYGAPDRPVPVAMLVHGVTAPAKPQAVDWFYAGAPLGLSGALSVSFHDSRGLPIDPLAVAVMFSDLLTWRRALAVTDTTPSAPPVPAPGADGSLTRLLADLAAGPARVRVHVVDPHGNAYRATRRAGQLSVIDNASVQQSALPANGLVELFASQSLGRDASDEAAETAATQNSQEQPSLYWGWAYNATLARTPLTAPALPAGVSLAVQFLRVIAVDLRWYLLGNRTSAGVGVIAGDDGATPAFAQPIVRPSVPNFDYLIDGMDALGASSLIGNGFPQAGADVLALLASPAIDETVAWPPAPGAAGHWPAFPAPNPGDAGFPQSADATRGVTAAFRAPSDGANANLDVIVTIASDCVPAGTHVRVFPRQFQQIDAIGERPSFVRGDGGATIAVAGQPNPVLLVNPFGLRPTDPLPSAARLTIDVVATSRGGARRLHSAIDVTVSTAAVAWQTNAARFDGLAWLQQPAIKSLMSVFGCTAVAPVSLFGIPAPPLPAGPAPTTLLDLVRRLANETTAPRQGPHLPTQARFETVLALGTAVAGPSLNWRAVTTGARLTEESRSAQPELGNPGNSGGPDVHAAGVRADGQLAYDLAFHTLKRTQPIIPMSATTFGWLASTDGNNWSFPNPDSAGTVSAAMLETIAPFCDSPELGLSAIPIPQPTNTIQSAVDALARMLGLPNGPTISVANEIRMRQELQREMYTARFGQRDALWALNRALSEAREFIYIESPQFTRTARPNGAPLPHEIDLVGVIAKRMIANPRLKVMICVPRYPDFAAVKANWVRAALRQRTEALSALISQDPLRVAAFHPIGFPGRSAVIRSTVVIVDDVWAMVGTSHFRRRGMTFDGGLDVVSIDRSLNARGTSSGVARFRQELMANKLGIAIPAGTADTTAAWTRLAEPEACFGLIAGLLSAGGLGRCSPVWAGPTDNSVKAQDDRIADPDGVDPDGCSLLALFGSLIIEN